MIDNRLSKDDKIFALWVLLIVCITALGTHDYQLMAFIFLYAIYRSIKKRMKEKEE